MNSYIQACWRVFLLGLLAGVMAGCLPTVAPPYKGGLAKEPTALTPYVNDQAGIRLGLPAGWVAEPITDTSDSELKAQMNYPAPRGGVSSTAQSL